jgi:hypothetical protein
MNIESTVLHDPTSEFAPVNRPRRRPPASLKGKTVALQDIGKLRSNEFLNYIEASLNRRGIKTLRTAKPTNAKRAPMEILQKIEKEADVVVQALAD